MTEVSGTAVLGTGLAVQFLNPDAWSIRSKLYGVSVLMLGVLVGLAALGVVGVNYVGARVSNMNQLAEHTTRAMEVDYFLETMRHSILRYALDHDAKALDEFRSATADAGAMLSQAATDAPTPDRRRTYATLRIGVDGLSVAGDGLVDTVKLLDDGRAKLDAAATALSDATELLIRSVNLQGNEHNTLETEKLQALLQAIQVTAWRGQTNRDAGAVPLIEQQSNAALWQLTILENEELNDQSRALLPSLKTAIANFSAAADAVIADAIEERDAYLTRIAPSVEAMEATIGGIKKQLLHSFRDNREDLGNLLSRGETGQEVFAAVVLMFGSIIAWLTTRAITKPIFVLTQRMRELAAGNFDVVLPGLGHNHEIGHIAGAVEVQGDFGGKGARGSRGGASASTTGSRGAVCPLRRTRARGG